MRKLADKIEREQGTLDILVNDIFGATTIEWDKTVWESSLDVGLRTLRLAIDTHAITAHFALPLLIRRLGVSDGGATRVRYARTSFVFPAPLTLVIATTPWRVSMPAVRVANAAR